MTSSSEHGNTRYTSKTDPCRCTICTQAHTDYTYDYSVRRRTLIQSGKIQVTHGLRKSYAAGCRCDLCKEAGRVYRAKYLKPKVHTCPTCGQAVQR